ncbi:MAG: nucleotide disphospho-sugar-binding domain-containing protein [Pseudomonadota bacterium]
MRRRRPAVVLATVGSLGDLYPILCIARALTAAGFEARLALSPEDCEMARTWGLLATPVGPSQAETSQRLGRSRDQIAADVLRDASPMVNDVLLPMLPDLTAEMAPLMEGAGIVAGTTFALHAALAAEGAGLPYVPLVLQPMMTLSALDPPRARRFGLMAARPRTALTRAWNRSIMGLGRATLRRKHLRRLNAVREGLGLPAHTGTPLLDPGPADVPLRLGLWSPHFSPPPPDAPDGLEVIGFPPAPDGDLSFDIQNWLNAGPPPLVVTLGSIAQSLGGEAFWTEAVALARRMGLRVILLHGTADVPKGPDILSRPYVPHAPLFPQAAAILHHGGIGTTAEALRAGRPQLVLPVGGDQPDNAARLERLGLATVLPIASFKTSKAHKALASLLARFDYAGAADLAAQITAETAPREAVLRLTQTAQRPRR